MSSAKLLFIIVLALCQSTTGYRFMRRIQAVGYPYYKIMMALGACKGKLKIYENIEILWKLNVT